MFNQISRLKSSINSTRLRFLSCSRTVRREAGHDMSDPLNPYHHTAGRWVHRDELQQESRYIDFDFSALCRKILEMSSGAQKIIRYEKIDGHSNRVFIFYLSNKKRVVAKLPFRIAGPARLTINSEIATMAYIRKCTNIPLPEILDWNDNNTNTIGSEYIIMEHAPGIQLRERWPSMDTLQHMKCIESLSKYVIQMKNLSFPAYGSLYFDTTPIDPKHKIAFGDFCIGPHCGPQYWDCNAIEAHFYHQIKPNRGPWLNVPEYCSALIDAGVSCIPPANETIQHESSYRGSAQEHLHLLEISKDVIRNVIEMPLIQDTSSPTLLHPRLHRNDIFVSDEDPTRITALIGWQSTSIDPTFMLADRTPDVIEPPILLTLPVDTSPKVSENAELAEDVGTAEDITPDMLDSPLVLRVPVLNPLLTTTHNPDSTDDTKNLAEEKARRLKDISISRQTFEIYMHTWAPNFRAARDIDKSLLRMFIYCEVSWESSAAALRQELIELSQRWTELGLPNACPYHPTEEELIEHTRQYDDYNAAQSLKLFLMGALDSTVDGWVPLERWEAARKFHKELFENWMETCARGKDDSDMSKEKGENMWPFDDVKRKM